MHTIYQFVNTKKNDKVIDFTTQKIIKKLSSINKEIIFLKVSFTNFKKNSCVRVCMQTAQKNFLSVTESSTNLHSCIELCSQKILVLE